MPRHFHGLRNSDFEKMTIFSTDCTHSQAVLLQKHSSMDSFDLPLLFFGPSTIC